MPYGFDFAKPVSRFEEALKVIRLLWDSDGPVDFDGQFYHLQHARLDTEPYDGKIPADLDRRQRAADAGDRRTLRRRLVAHRRVDSRGLRRKSSPPYGLRRSGPAAIRWPSRRATSSLPDRRDDAAIAEMLDAPLVKAFLLQVSAEVLAQPRL